MEIISKSYLSLKMSTLRNFSQGWHTFATATKMHNVSGLGSGGAARSFNLLMKSKYMDEITGGKGQTYASGTPIITGYQRSETPILRCIIIINGYDPLNLFY